jgi:hypothetical protein
MYDIAESWKVLLVSCFVAIAVAYIFLFAIRFLGGIMIWAAFGFTFLLLLCAGLYTYFYVAPTIDPASPNHNYVKWGAYSIWAVDLILVLAMMCCYSAIQLGIAVFACTVQYLQNNMEVFCLPILTAVMSIVWYAVWLLAAVYIFSVGNPEPRPGFEFITIMRWS